MKRGSLGKCLVAITALLVVQIGLSVWGVLDNRTLLRGVVGQLNANTGELLARRERVIRMLALTEDMSARLVALEERIDRLASREGKP